MPRKDPLPRQLRVTVACEIFGKIHSDAHIVATLRAKKDLVPAIEVLLIAPPAHTSATLTQQCDLSSFIGGPIACEKACFRTLITRQIRASILNGPPGQAVRISDAQIAGLYELAISQTWPGIDAAALNSAVGYYVDAENDFLAYDVVRSMDVAAVATSAGVGGSGISNVFENQSGRAGWAAERRNQQEQQARLAAMSPSERVSFLKEQMEVMQRQNEVGGGRWAHAG